jgi:hypothetical protein
MSEVVCSKSVTGGRRISWKKTVSLSVGSGQMVVSKKSSSETTLEARGLRFSYTFGILHVAGIFVFFLCVCSAYTAVSIPKYTASIL